MLRGNRDVLSGSFEHRYRLLVEAIVDYAIYMLDPDSYVVSWNPGAQRFKGYKAAEIIGHHFSQFYTEEDRAAGLPERALATAASEGRYGSEGWRLRKDGSRFWTHAIIDPIRDPSGKLIGFAKITRDLTERKAAEAALKQSEAQFRLLVQSVTDYAIYMLDPSGRIVSWNAGAERIKGYDANEIVGQHFSRFYMDEERERGEPQRGLRTAAKEGRFEKEGWRVRKDGTRFWASVVIDAIRDERGELIGFAKVTRDITEKKEAQRALEEAREALFQAQKLEAIGQLTGGIAHDFNNLLMVILSSLDLLVRRLPAEDARVRTLVDNAMQAAQRGAALTQRMLAFARRQELRRSAVDIPMLVNGISELLQRTLGPQIRLEFLFPAALPKVHTDANQLESALLNLALNARDAMPSGGPLIISAREEFVETGYVPRLSPGHYICLSVEDRGEGMDQEVLARATDPFFTTKGVGKGTGLGLSMVQGLAEQSGGWLRLDSKKGEGTTAEIWLPIATAEELAEICEPAAENAVPDQQSRLVAMVVDDDPLVLLNTAAMLEDLGHIVIEASSGEEALNALRRKKDVDIVITDQAMPGMRGDELANAIRAEWPDLPVIIATGFAELSQSIRVQFPRLSKPFNQEQLASKLSEALAAHALSR